MHASPTWGEPRSLYTTLLGHFLILPPLHNLLHIFIFTKAWDFSLVSLHCYVSMIFPLYGASFQAQVVRGLTEKIQWELFLRSQDLCTSGWNFRGLLSYCCHHHTAISGLPNIGTRENELNNKNKHRAFSLLF